MPGWWYRFGAVGVLVAGIGLVAASPAEGAIVGSGEAVPGSYIVSLRDTAALRSGGVAAVTAGLAGKFRAKVTRTFGSALHGFAASMSETDARRLAGDPAVAAVQRNQIHSINDTQFNPTSWGLDRVDQRWLPLDARYRYPNSGALVHAYIVDTGIRMTHTTFQGRATSGIDTIDNDADASDCHGHGTHVAGTVGGAEYGVAKGAWLVAVRVMNCLGKGTTEQVVGGVDWVTANAIRPAVVNMSIGGEPDPALDKAVTASIATGLTYGISAGNGDFRGIPQDACTVSPARVPEAITVSATTPTDEKLSFANYGSCVDLFAPGAGILSAWKDGDESSTVLSGTSMAAPHVVGAAALILAAHPAWSPAQVRDYLVGLATESVVTGPGPDSPNLLLFVDNSPYPEFSMWTSPVAGTVLAGDSINTAIATFVTAAPTQPVLLGLPSLPPGVAATITPGTVTAGYAATLHLVTSVSTPPGNYEIIIWGTGTSTIHWTTYRLTVVPRP